MQDQTVVMPDEATRNDSYTNFAEALEAAKQIRFTMAVTHAGSLSSRPLTTQGVDPDGTLWFFISARSELAADVAADPEILLVFAEPADGRYLSVHGRAQAMIDTSRARRLWSRMDSVYFKDGPEDKDLRVLRVDVSEIELWEPRGTRLGQYLKLAAAAMGAPVDTTQFGRHDVITPTGG